MKVTRLIIVLSSLAFVAGLGWAASADAFQPAKPGDPTFILSGFGLEYPQLREDQETGNTISDDSAADVTFTQTWSTDTYPGDVECLINLFDASGAIVGTQRTFASSLTKVTPAVGEGIGVAVDGEPVRAEGACEAGPVERGYHRILDPRIVQQDGETFLTGRVEWSGTPDTSACVAELQSAHGPSDLRFTIDAPDGYKGVIALPGEELANASVTSVTCEPYTG